MFGELACFKLAHRDLSCEVQHSAVARNRTEGDDAGDEGEYCDGVTDEKPAFRYLHL